mmetsp:Transcript_49864/g.154074  ORF Transcript_49864/g.154074 Transcript_49864/m.154074 type:complete len:278 (-) Transcript_49864:801-1634(-)
MAAMRGCPGNIIWSWQRMLIGRIVVDVSSTCRNNCSFVISFPVGVRSGWSGHTAVARLNRMRESLGASSAARTAQSTLKYFLPSSTTYGRIDRRRWRSSYLFRAVPSAPPYVDPKENAVWLCIRDMLLLPTPIVPARWRRSEWLDPRACDIPPASAASQSAALRIFASSSSSQYRVAGRMEARLFHVAARAGSHSSARSKQSRMPQRLPWTNKSFLWGMSWIAAPRRAHDAAHVGHSSMEWSRAESLLYTTPPISTVCDPARSPARLVQIFGSLGLT